MKENEKDNFEVVLDFLRLVWEKRAFLKKLFKK